MSELNNYLNSREKFDANKLFYIISNYSLIRNQLRKPDKGDRLHDPLTLAKKYLHNSRNGEIGVTYKQNNGKGRFFAGGSLSLQNLEREIRQTIAQDYYIDIDIKNSHPAILSYLCEQKGFECKYLNQYVDNREQTLQNLMDACGINREKAKQVYLAVMNGGDKDFKYLKECGEIPSHMFWFKSEMNSLHTSFAEAYPEEFKALKTKREASGHNYNHSASFMNTLMCDFENKILMVMYNFFGRPDYSVLCFDGIMLPNDRKYNLKACQKEIRDQLGISMGITQKPFKDLLKGIPAKLPIYKSIELNYFEDFVNFEGMESVRYEWVHDWAKGSIMKIINGGKSYLLTKTKNIVLFPDGTKETTTKWFPRKEEDVLKCLGEKINITNPTYDYDFAKEYFKMNRNKKLELDLPKDVLKARIKKNLFTYLGCSSKRYGDGFLDHMLSEKKLIRYAKTDFYPYLKSNGDPSPKNVFNMFTGFPFDNLGIEYKGLKFENTKLYTHLKNDFFSSEGELNHFLDCFADMIQDPQKIKGISHVFYSKPGCGKGLLYKFATRMLGSANCISIDNPTIYFNSNFNSNRSYKILKCFEEVEEKGQCFRNNDRLKAEQTKDTERIEPKGMDPFHVLHCARYWYFTNNEKSLYIEGGDRRHTMHKIKPTHANNLEYFAPLWDEINDPRFLQCAFDFFATRKYSKTNVMKAFSTKYKQEQLKSNLSLGEKFILDFIRDEIKRVENKVTFVKSCVLLDKWKDYCERGSYGRRPASGLKTQLSKLGISFGRFRIQCENNKLRISCYKINPCVVQQHMRDKLSNDKYILETQDSQQSYEVLDESSLLSTKLSSPFD